MKQRGVSEYAIEIVLGKIELEEILLPYFAAAISACHGGELRGAFQAYCDVAEFGKDLKVTPRPAAKIKYRIRRLTLDALQQRSDVLVDVVIARAFPKIFGVLVVVTQREITDLCQVFRIQFHVRSGSPTRPACTRHGDLGASKRSRLKAANAATVKKYLKPGVIRDLD